MFKIGIIGLHHLHSEGYIKLLKSLPEAEVVGLADEDERLLREMGERYGIERLHADRSELIEGKEVDLVVILLPHALCPDAAVEACRAGKHVVVEKPMADKSEGILRMMGAAEEANVRLTTPYLWRYSGAAQRIKRMIESDEIGEVVAFEGRFIAGPPSRYVDGGAEWMLKKEMSGGGPLHNLGVHWIDLFRWLLGEEILFAAGRVNSLTHHLEIEDNAHALLVFEGGAVASIDISYSAADRYDLFVQVRGRKGVISWTPKFDGANLVEICSGRSRELIEIEEEKVEGYGGMWAVRFFEELFRAIEGGDEPFITAYDGYRALKAVEAIYESSRTGRFVEVDEGID